MQSHLKSLIPDLMEYGKITTIETSNIFKEKVYTIERSRELKSKPTISNAETTKSYRRLSKFYDTCDNINICTNNSIAFFDGIAVMLDFLNCHAKEQLQTILTFALGQNGYPFATYYGYEKLARVHPCNLVIEELKLGADNSLSDDESRDCSIRIQEAVKSSIMSLANCLEGNFYAMDCQWIDEYLLAPLKKGAQIFQDWDTLLNTPASNPFSHMSISRANYKLLWGIYEKYTKYLYSKRNISEYNNAVKVLESIKEIAVIILTLERFWIVLEKIKKLAPGANCQYKRKWLQLYRHYILEVENKSRNITSPFLTENNEPEILVNTLKLTSFLSIARNNYPAADVLKSSPLWDDTQPCINLTSDEEKTLQGYTNHLIYKFIKGMESILSNEGPLKAAPFFLASFLSYTTSPVIPFKTGSYEINKNHTKFEPEFCSPDPRQICIQKAHQYLYRALWRWWLNVHPKDFDPNLSHYLFQRTQLHILNYDSFPDIEFQNYYPAYSERSIYMIQNRLENLLEIKDYMFPQYTRNIIEHVNIQDFYDKISNEIKHKENIWDIRRILQKTITKNVAEEYKRLALIGFYGIGTAERPQSWHENLADWLESIIRSDSKISNYVEGKLKNVNYQEPLFPGSDFKVGKFRESLIEMGLIEPGRAFCAEEFLPYLAQVQLLIQKICCRMIKDDMMPRVIQIYRKVFLDD